MIVFTEITGVILSNGLLCILNNFYGPELM
jgi:hypothetical protein